MRRSFAFVVFALLAAGANARALSGLLYTDPAEIAAVNAAQEKGASEYYAASAASSVATTNQVTTINGNNNVVSNDATTLSNANAASEATDSTDVIVQTPSPSPSPSPIPSPSPSPSPCPSPSPIPSPSPKPCAIVASSPAPGSSPYPNGSPAPSGGCLTNWNVGDAGYFSDVNDVAFADPVPLVGCDGRSLSPKDPVSKFSDCSSECSATPGCFSFTLDSTNRCTFVTNDSDSPIKISKGSRIFFWQGSYQMIDSSKLPSNCFSNATVPHN